MNNYKKNSQGFTLIELLIVIVIIGILAAVVLAILNPARQQTRANQAILQSNTAKMCLAMNACMSATGDVTDCDTVAEAGINVPSPASPTGATYTITPAAPTITLVGAMGTGATLCEVTCSYNATTGASTGPTVAGAGCVL